MLQRQQASAIIDARKMIVDGAVGMVEMALERLSENNVVALDEERKAAMVSNLLVVLCGNHDAQPVVNSGKPVLIWRKRKARRSRCPCACPRSCMTAIAAWAEDDFRSVNGQIEYLLVRMRPPAEERTGKYVSDELDKPPELDI